VQRQFSSPRDKPNVLKSDARVERMFRMCYSDEICLKSKWLHVGERHARGIGEHGHDEDAGSACFPRQVPFLRFFGFRIKLAANSLWLMSLAAVRGCGERARLHVQSLRIAFFTEKAALRSCA
jgi:hypothetical protein